MSLPLFQEVLAPNNCGCPGCDARRCAARSARVGRATTGALMVAMATATTVGGAIQVCAAQPAAAAPGPAAAGHTAVRATARQGAVTSRAEILRHAQHWVDRGVRYSMGSYFEGYRQDCSGFVSMAWGLSGSQWTGSLASYGVRVSKSDLQPGDMLLYHNAANPVHGSHVVLFGGWTDASHTHYVAYELTPPHAMRRVTPFPYWNHTSGYVAYRSRTVTPGGGQGGGGTPARPAQGTFPGAGVFGPGQHNTYVTELGEMLVQRGGARFYSTGPGPSWGQADQRATAAFQRAQGWRGAEADGIPGPDTWRLLANGTGHDIPAASGGGGTADGVPAFPGRGVFRPGQSNSFVAQLGRQLVKKGFGQHYAVGPGPSWSESDRRNVEAFQRAQGWRGAEADGIPGPETWRRLFR
ncbi:MULTISPECIES: peptidoglycan-binding protein [Streptomyces]|uniref:peptidoglycan-binding protein n=1 Tax=Streptomyces TaxID=1883 RepID=UPI001E36EE58|nr:MULTISPECIES: peptidoglycan-binding protein [Streptomyces]UFQ18578.1 peptidoglycan-binding protein [Streptomyces huasconensis]WCL88193.1 peptidoglycan-binding protein [Streptomyces sp. JCM 35825]